ncbi:DUF742 domain-containing protein [Amycolatopsis sp. PS_44_ISF1]|uniref:DUF742 domain-containing protein n=1 Tax=Amycolatopsis sp. PS_44_ISF1 TaxID=2974917 RepID=UPI0028E09204|nr:DUF742 domain-containing protein [Amycolatopsis sp. PS_44_ISF1]MDT8910591.1 DUF742 domain-containing protein [Amycolatopsis sp. PS_44_ISF1]
MPDPLPSPAPMAVGARFPGPKLAERLAGESPVSSSEPAPAVHPAERTDAAYSGTLGEENVRRHNHPEEPEIPGASQPDFTSTGGQWDDGPETPPPHPRTLVRPYVLTRGRTQSRRHLAIEALVSTCVGRAEWNNPQMSGEFHSVRTMCHSPRSVAEVASTLSVPLGVARILLDDMAELGLVRIHENDDTGDGRPALALMERVLSGLHRL